MNNRRHTKPVIAFLFFIFMSLGSSYSINPEKPGPDTAVIVAIDRNVLEGRLDERYLGVSIDTAQFIAARVSQEELAYYGPAGALDLGSPKLRRVTAQLGPLIFRVGGTDADGVYFCPQERPCELPQSYRDAYRDPEKFQPSILTRDDVQSIAEFADAVDATVMFCLNFGPGPRDPRTGAWRPDNARELVRFAKSLPAGRRFQYWEAGNEVNGLFFNFKMPPSFGPKMYVKDLKTLREVLDHEDPESKISAPASYIFPLPIVGDPFRFTARVLKRDDGLIDIVNWHLYATQGDRCGKGFIYQPYPPTLENLFSEKVIQQSIEYARYIKNAAAERPVWLGETASAQCGGQPGVSDTMLDALWFSNWIGIMAREGTSTIIRQTLLGWHYGVIDHQTFEPRPTMMAMLMHRRLAAKSRLHTTVAGHGIMAHAYYSANDPSAVSVVIINPGPEPVALEVQINDTPLTGARQWTLSSPDGPTGKTGLIEEMAAHGDGTIPFPSAREVKLEMGRATVTAEEWSVTFVELHFGQNKEY